MYFTTHPNVSTTTIVTPLITPPCRATITVGSQDGTKIDLVRTYRNCPTSQLFLQPRWSKNRSYRDSYEVIIDDCRILWLSIYFFWFVFVKFGWSSRLFLGNKKKNWESSDLRNVVVVRAEMIRRAYLPGR